MSTEPRVRFAQKVGRGGKVMSTFEVLVDREIVLNERLTDIERRYLRHITLVIHPGFDDARVVTLDRTDARKLADALAVAINETREWE